jgi:hypothetical protein
MMRSLRAAALLIGLAFAASGCTAGAIVNKTGLDLLLPGTAESFQVLFQSLDHPDTYFETQASYSVPGEEGNLVFSFDSQGPSTAYNSLAYIPEGNYQIRFSTGVPGYRVTFGSDPLHHTYSKSCQDYYSKVSEPCSLYILQLTKVSFDPPASPCGAATTQGAVTTVPMCGQFLLGAP